MKRTLYLGTDPSMCTAKGHIIHYPVIQIVPRTIKDEQISQMLAQFDAFTFVILTSKNAVKILSSLMKQAEKNLHRKTICAIGRITALYLEKCGVKVDLLAAEETQEGLIDLLQPRDLQQEYILYPKSSRARPLFRQFLEQHQVRHFACDLYDTIPQKPVPSPDLDTIDEIIFTSPSTVETFFEIYPSIPSHITLTPIGPVTESALRILLY